MAVPAGTGANATSYPLSPPTRAIRVGPARRGVVQTLEGGAANEKPPLPVRKRGLGRKVEGTTAGREGDAEPDGYRRFRISSPPNVSRAIEDGSGTVEDVTE